DDHEMHVQRLGRRAPNRLDDDRSEAEVGHEATVHDVNVDPVRSGGIDRADFVAEASEIGGEDGRGDDERLQGLLVADSPRTPASEEKKPWAGGGSRAFRDGGRRRIEN